MEWLIHLPGSARRGGPAVATAATVTAASQHRIPGRNPAPAGALPAFIPPTVTAARWPGPGATPARPPDATGAAPPGAQHPTAPAAEPAIPVIGRYRNAASVPPARPPQHRVAPAAEGTQRPTSNPTGAAWTGRPAAPAQGAPDRPAHIEGRLHHSPRPGRHAHASRRARSALHIDTASTAASVTCRITPRPRSMATRSTP